MHFVPSSPQAINGIAAERAAVNIIFGLRANGLIAAARAARYPRRLLRFHAMAIVAPRAQASSPSLRTDRSTEEMMCEVSATPALLFPFRAL
jgi:pimeloyl-ACP methyl ester carboxylesterase